MMRATAETDSEIPSGGPAGPAVDHLVLLAAPSCCGKSRFLEELQEGRLHALADALGIERSADGWQILIPRELQRFEGQSIPRLILHFAIPSIAINDGELADLAEEPRLQVVPRSVKVTVVTLLASAGTLARRWRIRNRENRKMIVFNVRRYFEERRRMQRLKELYGKPHEVTRAYDAWFRYVDRLPNLHASWVVTAEDDYEAFPRGEWTRLRRRYLTTYGDTGPQSA